MSGTRSFHAAVAAMLVAASFAAGGASWVGPDVIRFGRSAYNTSILGTGDEQLLQNIVRLRFCDSIGFLAVSSTAPVLTIPVTGRR